MALGLSHVCLFHVNALMRKVALHRSPTERKVPPGCRVVTSRVCRTQVHPQTSPGSLGVRELEGAMLDLRVHTHTLIHTHSRSCTLVQAHSHMLTRVHTLHIHSHMCVLSPTHMRMYARRRSHTCALTRNFTHACVRVGAHPPHSHTLAEAHGMIPAAGASVSTAESRPPLLVTVPELSSVLSHEGREEAALGDFKGPFPSRLLNSAGPRLNRLHYEIT